MSEKLILNPNSSTDLKNNTRVSVCMNEVRDIEYDPSIEQRPSIETSALNGCICLVALFRGSDINDASVLLSHFPPSGNSIESANYVSQAVSSQFQQGRKSDLVVIMAPGKWEKDETTGYFTIKPYATIEPDLNGYRSVFSASEGTQFITVGYVPDDSVLQGLHADPNAGTMRASMFPDVNGAPQLSVISEGVSVPTVAK